MSQTKTPASTTEQPPAEQPPAESADSLLAEIRMALLRDIKAAVVRGPVPEDYVDVTFAKQAADVYVTLFGGV